MHTLPATGRLLWAGLIFLLPMAPITLGQTTAITNPAAWTIYIANDNCPDYTWGYTEEQTRKAFADIVRAHLDEMKRTDNQPAENQNRYNMAVTQEALCFVERYPERQAELIQRIKEGRITVSPFLCNSLWGLNHVEGAIRNLYPARRLEREWKIPIDIAEHIEEPSLPWGMATVLAGCGVRWLSVPFYNYDSTFRELRNPPVFYFAGPDGNGVRVIMDSWASHKASYAQGAQLLNNPKSIEGEWLPHYQKLGAIYPWPVIFASGTHSDISPQSGNQARGFADKIIQYNATPAAHPKLVNATLGQFCAVLDKQAVTPPTVRGCFGHSWELWPVSLARYVADLRQAERDYLAAETLAALAAWGDNEFARATRAGRERAEWCWAMLSDHAWNGTDEKNKRHNAALRRQWAQELREGAEQLTAAAWNNLASTTNDSAITLFNSLSFPRRDLVRLYPAPNSVGSKNLNTQIVVEDGQPAMYCVSAELPGFGFAALDAVKRRAAGNQKLSGDHVSLDGPFYRLKIDLATGGIGSLRPKRMDMELVNSTHGRTICQPVYFDGREQRLENVKSELVALGPVLARLRITGEAAGIQITNYVTIYAELDRVDLEVRVHKPVTSKQDRLCHYFPFGQSREHWRIETPGAVIRPAFQPAGDLLPGADHRRFAVQNFFDFSPPGQPGITVALLDAFALRLDLDEPAIEVLGNDQNYKEVVQDQDRVQHFRFRYSLRAHAPEFRAPEAFTWSRQVAQPLLVFNGRLPKRLNSWSVQVPPSRAIATCLKPVDDPQTTGIAMRLWEVAGDARPVVIPVSGFTHVYQTDLLERRRHDLKIARHAITLPMPKHGITGIVMRP